MINFKTNFCLKPFNTFRIAVQAARFAAISCISDLHDLFETGELRSNKWLILSQGSNVLFTDHVNGLVLHNEMWGKNLVFESDDFVLLKVNAGESWAMLVDYSVTEGWGGIENLALIPGKVGASPIQNIGAYGVEVKDVIDSVEAFDMQTGELVTFSNDECQFGYRTSIFKTTFKNRYFITSVVFKLTKNPVLNLSYQPLQLAFAGKKDATLAQVRDEVVRIRQSKLPDPDKFPNAGSFFKNPVVGNAIAQEMREMYPTLTVYEQEDGSMKLAAGWLIEQCGFKGKRKCDVGVHEQQALVIVNYGEATGKEVFAFAEEIVSAVKAKFGVELCPEVNVYP